MLKQCCSAQSAQSPFRRSYRREQCASRVSGPATGDMRIPLLGAPTGSNLCRRARRCLVLILVLTVIMAAPPGGEIPGEQGRTEQEHVRPGPPPPAADPLKLALGERL